MTEDPTAGEIAGEDLVAAAPEASPAPEARRTVVALAEVHGKPAGSVLSMTAAAAMALGERVRDASKNDPSIYGRPVIVID